MELIEVHCYSGYKAGEKPASFVFRDKRLEVLEIKKRWYEQDLKPGSGTRSFFRLKAEDNRTYLIFYDQQADRWFLEKIYPEET